MLGERVGREKRGKRRKTTTTTKQTKKEESKEVRSECEREKKSRRVTLYCNGLKISELYLLYSYICIENMNIKLIKFVKATDNLKVSSGEK